MPQNCISFSTLPCTLKDFWYQWWLSAPIQYCVKLATILKKITLQQLTSLNIGDEKLIRDLV